MGRPLFWSAGPLSAAQRTTEMIVDQRNGKNGRPELADYGNGASAILHFLAYFQKYFIEKKLSNSWGLIPILTLILRNSKLRSSELRNSKLLNRELRHAMDYSENSGSGIAELRISSSGLQ